MKASPGMSKAEPSKLKSSPAWKALTTHQRDMATHHLRELFAADPERVQRCAIGLDGLFLDYSKHRITVETHRLLLALAQQADVPGWINGLFAGEKVNNTENRAAMHMALRSDADTFSVGPERNVMPLVHETRARMLAFAAALRDGRIKGVTGKAIRSVVNLGVGGSDLGPRMAVRALRTCAPADLRVRFAANADPADLDAALEGLDPATTLFIVASKTFTTVETMSNARRARIWLAAALGDTPGLAAHFTAVTAATDKAAAFGITPEQIFPMWNWVGGRYSIWSAVGLPIAIAAGPQAFEAMLEGGHIMDRHFREAPLERNMPATMALLSVWYAAFFGAETSAVLPYSEDLRELPAYLQQLQMESNGKRVNRDGQGVDYPTSPVLWGTAGTVSQHSFHQLLLQGTHLVPVDFIVPIRAATDGSTAEDGNAQRMLVANALAQGAALMAGSPFSDPHRASPGNGPSSTLLMDQLTPRTLGMLVALYEHKVFVEGVLLGINSFDQWGVELGKALAKAIQDGEPGTLDPSTRALMARIEAERGQH
jgi:glucose-6-phosphate isomerase